jgi:hypothetical protein
MIPASAAPKFRDHYKIAKNPIRRSKPMPRFVRIPKRCSSSAPSRDAPWMAPICIST